MPQTAPELKKRVEDADLWPESTKLWAPNRATAAERAGGSH
jgi:hypothetical protein